MGKCILDLGPCIYGNFVLLLRKAFERNIIVTFRIECESPSGPCTPSPETAPYVKEVMSFDWDYYWETFPGHAGHIEMTRSKYCCCDGCGLVNRIYLRKDGVLVFSHDDNDNPGVHVVVPVDEIRQYLAEQYKKLADIK